MKGKMFLSSLPAGKNEFLMHSVGFEPTSANTVQLECTPLDRSGTNANSICLSDVLK
jgi:hypothetical protein